MDIFVLVITLAIQKDVNLPMLVIVIIHVMDMVIPVIRVIKIFVFVIPLVMEIPVTSVMQAAMEKVVINVMV